MPAEQVAPAATARPTPSRGAGDRGQRRAATTAPTITIKPEQQRLPARLRQRSSAPGRARRAGYRQRLPRAVGRPSSVRSWRITIIAPTPHEKPETTA